MNRLLRQIIPFIVIGIVIVTIIFGMMLLAYIFLFGAILGLILFIIRWIRDKFFSSHKITKRGKKPGRVIDSDDWKKL